MQIRVITVRDPRVLADVARPREHLRRREAFAGAVRYDTAENLSGDETEVSVTVFSFVVDESESVIDF